MSGTVNEDGSPVRIEAFYWRHFSPYVYEADSVEAAQRFLESGADSGDLAAVGVFVDGRCVTTHYWDFERDEPDTAEELSKADEAYREANPETL